MNDDYIKISKLLDKAIGTDSYFAIKSILSSLLPDKTYNAQDLVVALGQLVENCAELSKTGIECQHSLLCGENLSEVDKEMLRNKVQKLFNCLEVLSANGLNIC